MSAAPAPLTAAMPLETEPVKIRFTGIGKRFGERWAVRDLSLAVRAGEIHALVGENGAGKTTLLGLLYGHHRPDTGSITIDGRELRLHSPRAAIACGIGMVHQDLQIYPRLSALENILIGAEPNRWGWISRAAARRRVTEICSKFDFIIDLDRPAFALPYAQRQQIELLRALNRDAAVLILDEPTSLLSEPEIERLFDLLRRLRAAGRTLLLVSHRLSEVFALADRITVLRRGRLVGTWAASAVTAEALAAKIMAAVEPPAVAAAAEATAALAEKAARKRWPRAEAAETAADALQTPAPLLEFEAVSSAGSSQDVGLEQVSFQAAAGEIIGFGAIVGNGLSALAGVLSGEVPVTSGRVRVAGRELGGLSTAARIRIGIQRLPANPDEEAALFDRPLWENLLLGHHRRRAFLLRGMIRGKPVRAWAEQRLAAFEVAYSAVGDPLRSLSGGNRQKLALARTLAENPRLVVLEQPTRGLDLRARAACYARLRRLSAAGATVLICSHDLDELFAVAERIGILYRGRLVGPDPAAALDRQSAARRLLGFEAAPGGGVPAAFEAAPKDRP